MCGVSQAPTLAPPPATVPSTPPRDEEPAGLFRACTPLDAGEGGALNKKRLRVGGRRD